MAAEGGGLELVAVNPGLVLGPVLGSDFSASIEAVKKLLDGSIPVLPRFGFNVVDVRDIARLHVLAMTTPEAAGQRFIGSGDFYWMSDVAKMLETGTRRQSEKGSLDPRARLRGADCGAVRSDCPGTAIRVGEAATGLVGEGATNVGMDISAGDRDSARHSAKPSGKQSGLSGRAAVPGR